MLTVHGQQFFVLDKYICKSSRLHPYGCRKHFYSFTFKDRAAEHGTIVRNTPTEGHDLSGVIERSLAHFQTVYEKLYVDLPSISKEDRSSLAFRALNDTPNYYKQICPTTLVYRHFPKIPEGTARTTMFKQAEVIRECTQLVSQMMAQGNIKDVQMQHNI